MKPNGTTSRVYAALVHRQFAFLPGEICITCGTKEKFVRQFPEHGRHRVTNVQAPWGAAPCVSKKEAALLTSRAARGVATRCVMVQKSAEAIVGAKVSSTEGLNNERQGADTGLSQAYR
jgi:RNA-directed DNA polymerase